MSRQSSGNWLTTRGFGAKRRGAAIHHCQNRSLHFEPLEDRHLLATITVDTLIDVNSASDGLTTLREAISAAAPGDMIDFSVTGTINLTLTGSGPEIDLGHLTVDKNLTIQGPGADLLTIKAYDPDPDIDEDGRRVFLVSDGDSQNLIDVTISGLTVTGGDPVVDEGAIGGEHTTGGAIRSHENLTVIECVITDSFTRNGGGIGNSRQVGATGPFNGTLTVVDSVISGNSAYDGGALFTQRGNMVVIRTTMENNFASNAGGGVFNLNGDLTLTDSTISGNESLNPEKDFSGKGGGVASVYGGSTMIEGSTISGNDSAYLGGGIFLNHSGTLTVKNSTISGNSADEEGGGIYVNYYANNTVTIAHSTITGNTITGNSAGTSGGGIGNGSLDVDVFLDHSIVAGNLRGAARDDLDGSFDARFSLVGDQRSASVNDLGGNLIGTSSSPIDAMLGPLADNGGPTLTHALMPGSPALDAGDPSILFDALEFDQRGTGFVRVADGGGGAVIDIGAYEAQSAPSADFDADGYATGLDFLAWQRGFGTPAPLATKADGDADNDQDVDGGDLSMWESQYLAFAPPSANFNADGYIDGLDFLAWQIGFGTTSGAVRADGDSDNDGDVDSNDLAVWELTYGQVDTTPLVGAVSGQLSAPVAAPVSMSQADLVDAAIAWDMAGDTLEQEPVLLHETSFAEQPATATNEVGQPVSISQESANSSLSNGSSEQQEPEAPWLSDELLESVFG